MHWNNSNQQFDEIYHLYVSVIFRYAYFKVSDRETALDITQDTFIRFWKTLSADQNIREPKAFLYFIAHGLVVDSYRKNRRGANLPLEKIDEGLIFTADDLENKIDQKDQINKILSKLQTIREDYRDVLLLYYVEDLPIEGIARALDKNENNVRVIIHRALKELKSIL